MRVGARREGRDFLVAHVDPFDALAAADRVGEAVEAVAHDAVHALDADGGEDGFELVGNGLHGSPLE